MREHEINKLDNFIMGWHMDDTTICDKIIKYYSFAEDKKVGIAYYGDQPAVFDKTIKDSVDCALPEYVRADYIQHLSECINFYIEKYKWCNEYSPWSTLERINIQYYPAGGGYHAYHTERGVGTGLTASRHLVFMTYLNDVTDAGETEFFHQKLKVKPQKGLTVIWPADWTFTHRGVSSPSQEKYIVTGWLNYVV